MKFCVCWETALFSIGLLLVIIHVAVSIRKAIRNASCSKLFEYCLQKACSIFKHLKEQSSQSESDKHVQNKLKVERLRAAKASYKANANCMCVCVVSILFNLALESPRWMTPGQDVAAILMFAVLEFASLGPRPVELLMDIYYGLTMLFVAAFLWFSSPEAALITCFTCLAMRSALSLQYRKMSSVFFWNVVSTCSSVAFFQRSAQDGTLASTMMIFEAVLVATLLFSVSAIHNWTVALIQQERKVSQLKMENSASVSLLDMSCDVVLRLRIDLTLEEDSRQFAALLMRSSGLSMQGVPFSHFITGEDDRGAFEEKVSALGASSDELVGSFCATLSDSLQNLVNVEMMFVQVSTHEEDSSYLLGIREVGDVDPIMPAFDHKLPLANRAMARKGTPPCLEPESFENKAPRSFRSTSAEVGLRFPEMIPTSSPAMCIQILEFMSRWNVKVPRTTCCSFHAYTAKLKQILQECSKTKCNESFPAALEQQLQCQSCGLFDPEERDAEIFECSICRSTDCKPLHVEAMSTVENAGPKNSISL